MTDIEPALAARTWAGPSWRTLLGGLWVSLALSLLIIVQQVDGVVGQVAVDGRTFSLTGLTGLPPADAAAWSALADAVAQGEVGGWLSQYALFDALFALFYGAGVGWLLVRRLPASDAGSRWRLVAIIAWGAGVVADLLESVLVWRLGPGVAAVLPFVSWAKWAGLLLGLFAAVLSLRQRPRPAGRRPWWRATLFALATHRYSLLVVVPFALLGLASGPDVLDQLPDVQRQWLDEGLARHLVVGGFLTVVVATVVFALGRMRSDNVARRVLRPDPDAADPDATPPGVPYEDPALRPWLVGPVVLVVGLLAVVALSDATVLVGRFAAFVVVPLVIAVGSWIWRRVCGLERSPAQPPVTSFLAHLTWVVGDLLAAAVLVVPGLGLVRAYAAPVVLDAGPGSRAMLVVGLVGVVVPWGAVAVLAWLSPVVVERWRGRSGSALLLGLSDVLVPGVEPSQRARGAARCVAWGLLLLAIALGAWAGAFPDVLARIGVIEAMLVCTASLAVMLGAVVVLLQAGGAPDLLARRGSLRLRSAPVTALLVVTALAAGLLGEEAQIHGLRASPGLDAPPPRPTLVDRLSPWAASEACSVPLGGAGDGLRVRPVFLLAAEGGGIRAAAWTALGADALAAAGGPCASALMSSGASGGAVGLTVAAFTRAPDGPTRTFGAVEAMAGPEALGSAVSGLLVRDPVRAVTGLPFLATPEAGGPGADRRVWVDRAGLMERVWDTQVDGLASSFLGAAQAGTEVPPGLLVLNSTSSSTSCRALLSQARLTATPTPDDCQVAGSIPASVDLLPTLRTGCAVRPAVPDLRASTVALLASRFPYVTPSGVVTWCVRDPDSASGWATATQQIVDGGYGDNDGLGTLVDVAAEWLPWLRDHNSGVVAAGSGTLLVPVVVYLDNGTGSDLAVRAPRTQLELLVPPVTKLSAKDALVGTDSALHRANDTFAVGQVLGGCSGAAPSSASPSPRAVCDAVARWRPQAVHVFFQPTTPSIEAPLGWVLSDASLATLRCARDRQVARSGLAPIGAGCSGLDLPDEGVSEGRGGCAGPVPPAEPVVRAKGYGSMAAALCLARAAGRR